ncbi:ABC transporter permease [Morganella morganii]|uniref:ABC transporter permease n=1 Tax=Morganella morganii TaxID=582 RepID=UPI001C482DE6|nr:ABC transporter permease [Morganella morganii]QXO51080.1 ABC transporter permease [Morganella morganii]
MSAPSGFSWRRLRALCIKESKQIVRDPSSALIAIVIPLILLFIFGYGINLDSSKLRLGILVNQQSEPARELISTFTGSPFIDATLSDNRHELIDKLQAGHIRGIVVIPADFDKRLARQGDIAPIQVITDGSEPNTANFVQGYASGIWQIWQQQRAQDKGISSEPLIDVRLRYWFNPAAVSQHFIIPGAISIIITVVGAILTSLVVAREWERGTMEALLSTQVTKTELLLVSPLTTGEIFVGKAVPALIVATVQASIVLVIGIFAYHIPFSGSLLLFYFTMVIYGLSLVGFGLLISALSATQQQAFIGVFVFMMPAVLLSGYIAPVENMPVWLQHITWVNPIRHFNEITKQIYLKDADFSVIRQSLWPLLVIAVTTGSAAYALFRRKIA